MRIFERLLVIIALAAACISLQARADTFDELIPPSCAQLLTEARPSVSLRKLVEGLPLPTPEYIAERHQIVLKAEQELWQKLRELKIVRRWQKTPNSHYWFRVAYEELATELEASGKNPKLLKQVRCVLAQEANYVDMLVATTVRWLLFVAPDYRNMHLTRDQIVHWGLVGLHKAAERFDPSFGFKFITYARHAVKTWIIQGARKIAKEEAARIAREQVLAEKIAQNRERAKERHNKPQRFVTKPQIVERHRALRAMQAELWSKLQAAGVIEADAKLPQIHKAIRLALEEYLKNIPSESALRQEIETVLKAQSEYSEWLLEGNKGLVITIAGRMTSYLGLAKDELIQWGLIGLMRATELYNPDSEFMFSTYAYRAIRHRMIRGAMQTAREIRRPEHVEKKLALMARKRAVFEAQFGREPSVEELSNLTGLSPEAVIKLDGVRRTTLGSLNKPINEEGKTKLDFVEDHSADVFQSVSDAEQNEKLARAMSEVLDERELAVISMRFGVGQDGREMTYEQIGERLGIVRQWVIKIEEAAVKKLRETLTAFAPEDYEPSRPTVIEIIGSTLSPLEIRILGLHYGLGRDGIRHTSHQIAELTHVHRTSVRRVLKRAKEKIREALELPTSGRMNQEIFFAIKELMP